MSAAPTFGCENQVHTLQKRQNDFKGMSLRGLVRSDLKTHTCTENHLDENMISTTKVVLFWADSQILLLFDHSQYVIRP